MTQTGPNSLLILNTPEGPTASVLKLGPPKGRNNLGLNTISLIKVIGWLLQTINSQYTIHYWYFISIVFVLQNIHNPKLCKLVLNSKQHFPFIYWHQFCFCFCFSCSETIFFREEKGTKWVGKQTKYQRLIIDYIYIYTFNIIWLVEVHGHVLNEFSCLYIQNSIMQTFRRYYHADAMYFILSLFVFLAIYNRIYMIIMCGHFK